MVGKSSYSKKMAPMLRRRGAGQAGVAISPTLSPVSSASSPTPRSNSPASVSFKMRSTLQSLKQKQASTKRKKKTKKSNVTGFSTSSQSTRDESNKDSVLSAKPLPNRMKMSQLKCK